MRKSGMGKKTALEIGGRTLQVSNLDKILYPANRFTKGQVIDYYIKVAPHILPHLKNRPLTLKRYPDGVTAEHFYEKDAPSYTPSWIKLASADPDQPPLINPNYLDDEADVLRLLLGIERARELNATNVIEDSQVATSGRFYAHALWAQDNFKVIRTSRSTSGCATTS